MGSEIKTEKATAEICTPLNHQELDHTLLLGEDFSNSSCAVATPEESPSESPRASRVKSLCARFSVLSSSLPADAALDEKEVRVRAYCVMTNVDETGYIKMVSVTENDLQVTCCDHASSSKVGLFLDGDLKPPPLYEEIFSDEEEGKTSATEEPISCRLRERQKQKSGGFLPNNPEFLMDWFSDVFSSSEDDKEGGPELVYNASKNPENLSPKHPMKDVELLYSEAVKQAYSDNKSPSKKGSQGNENIKVIINASTKVDELQKKEICKNVRCPHDESLAIKQENRVNDCCDQDDEYCDEDSDKEVSDKKFSKISSAGLKLILRRNKNQRRFNRKQREYTPVPVFVAAETKPPATAGPSFDVSDNANEMSSLVISQRDVISPIRNDVEDECVTSKREIPQHHPANTCSNRRLPADGVQERQQKVVDCTEDASNTSMKFKVVKKNHLEIEKLENQLLPGNDVTEQDRSSSKNLPTKEKSKKRKLKRDKAKELQVSSSSTSQNAMETEARLELEFPRHNWLAKHIMKEKKLKESVQSPPSSPPAFTSPTADDKTYHHPHTEEETAAERNCKEKIEIAALQDSQTTVIQLSTTKSNESQHSMIGIVKPFQHLKKLSPERKIITLEEDTSLKKPNLLLFKENSKDFVSEITPIKRREKYINCVMSHKERPLKEIEIERCFSLAVAPVRRGTNQEALDLTSKNKDSYECVPLDLTKKTAHENSKNVPTAEISTCTKVTTEPPNSSTTTADSFKETEKAVDDINEEVEEVEPQAELIEVEEVEPQAELILSENIKTPSTSSTASENKPFVVISNATFVTKSSSLPSLAPSDLQKQTQAYLPIQKCSSADSTIEIKNTKLEFFNEEQKQETSHINKSFQLSSTDRDSFSSELPPDEVIKPVSSLCNGVLSSMPCKSNVIASSKYSVSVSTASLQSSNCGFRRSPKEGYKNTASIEKHSSRENLGVHPSFQKECFVIDVDALEDNIPIIKPHKPKATTSRSNVIWNSPAGLPPNILAHQPGVPKSIPTCISVISHATEATPKSGGTQSRRRSHPGFHTSHELYSNQKAPSTHYAVDKFRKVDKEVLRAANPYIIYPEIRKHNNVQMEQVLRQTAPSSQMTATNISLPGRNEIHHSVDVNQSKTTPFNTWNAKQLSNAMQRIRAQNVLTNSQRFSSIPVSQYKKNIPYSTKTAFSQNGHGVSKHLPSEVRTLPNPYTANGYAHRLPNPYLFQKEQYKHNLPVKPMPVRTQHPLDVLPHYSNSLSTNPPPPVNFQHNNRLPHGSIGRPLVSGSSSMISRHSVIRAPPGGVSIDSTPIVATDRELPIRHLRKDALGNKTPVSGCNIPKPVAALPPLSMLSHEEAERIATQLQAQKIELENQIHNLNELEKKIYSSSPYPEKKIPSVCQSHPTHYVSFPHSVKRKAAPNPPFITLSQHNPRMIHQFHASQPPMKMMKKHSQDQPSSHAPRQNLEEHCVACKKKAFFVCSGCRGVWYCSKHCQLDDWSNHSKICS